jgi:hypothetical protein
LKETTGEYTSLFRSYPATLPTCFSTSTSEAGLVKRSRVTVFPYGFRVVQVREFVVLPVEVSLL